MVLYTFIMLYSRHCSPSPELFSCYKTEGLSPLSNHPALPLVPAPSTHPTFSLYDFDDSKYSCKCNHTVFVFLNYALISFSRDSLFNIQRL